MSYITRVLCGFGMRSLNRLFSHFFWLNLSTNLVLFDLRRPREACAYLPKGSLVLYAIESEAGIETRQLYMVTGYGME